MSIQELKGKTVLVGALNWGLGHASRCMPIIERLLTLEAKVILASDGDSLRLLKEQYPTLKAFELPSYNVRYGSHGMVRETLLLVPNYIKAIKSEHSAIDALVSSFAIDLIISDNRYGLWSKKVPSVFIGHQLAILPPKAFMWGRKVVYDLQMQFVKKFNYLWIPDFEQEGDSLSGSLSHKYELPRNSHFIGAVTRFKKAVNIEKTPPYLNDLDIIVVLSGPEPQRSYLEHKIIEQAKKIEDRKFLIVCGRTASFEIQEEKHLTILSYLNAEALNRAILNANTVIARSGYSTIMDLAYLEKKAILIPTAGQTEQEYLADRLRKQNKIVVAHQGKLNLKGALIEVEKIQGFKGYKMEHNLLDEALKAIHWG